MVLRFDRALGCANHITVGESFLRERTTRFSCNADKGHTWPEPDACTTFANNTSFTYPSLPSKEKDADSLDWTTYPRGEAGSTNSDLCTLRIVPTDKHGWMVAENRSRGAALVVYSPVEVSRCIMNNLPISARMLTEMSCCLSDCNPL